jgi:hypothetical protein
MSGTKPNLVTLKRIRFQIFTVLVSVEHEEHFRIFKVPQVYGHHYALAQRGDKNQ